MWISNKFIPDNNRNLPVQPDALRRSSRTERCVLRELPASSDCPVARSPGNCDAEPSKIMGSQARCASRRIAVLCLAIRRWSGCQAGNFLCTETARGRRRTTERSPALTQCRQRLRDKMLPASPDRDRQSTAMANPKSPAVSSPRRQPSDSPWRFVVLRLPP